MEPRHRSGPVRSDAARLAVLEATAKLFEERGYDQLTIEGIATHARVSKQTVYRWWSSKGELIAESLFSGFILPGTLSLQDTGDLRHDLQTWLERLFHLLQQPRGEDLMRSLIAAAAEHEAVGVRLREALAGEGAVSARFQSAVDRGEISENARVVELSEAVIGVVILHAITRSPLQPEAASRLIDALLAGTSDAPTGSA